MCWCRLIFKSPRISVVYCIALPERIGVLVYWGSHNTVKHGPQDDTVLLSRGFCSLSDVKVIMTFLLMRSRNGFAYVDLGPGVPCNVVLSTH